MKTALVFLSITGLAFLIWPQISMAAPSSSNYVLDGYTFGSGGSNSDTGSGTTKLFGSSGDLQFNPSSSNYALGSGLSFALQTPTPATPNIENTQIYYDRLKVTLDPSANSSDTEYAIAISPDNFVTTQYITTALTLGGSPQYQSYAAWGGASGAIVTGLEQGTTYSIKVKALEADFTESTFSQADSEETELPSLTFTASGAVNMGVWNESNAYSSTANSTLTTSTNAYNGYQIYGYAATGLTRVTGGATIAAYGGTHLSPGSWVTGTGFGYTTNDTTIAGVPLWNQATCPYDSGAPLCYAAFASSGPGDVVADHESVLSAGPIVDEAFNVTYKVVTSATQAAGQYSSTIVYTIAPTY